MMTGQRLVQVGLILCGLAAILNAYSIFYEGFSLLKFWSLFLLMAGSIQLFRMSRRFKIVRATFVMQPDGIEDRVAQAMAASGFTIEPHSQIGNSFTFRALGSRLVVTKTASGIEVVGPLDRIDQLANKLGIIPLKHA
jgi:hypothetical protein